MFYNLHLSNITDSFDFKSDFVSQFPILYHQDKHLLRASFPLLCFFFSNHRTLCCGTCNHDLFQNLFLSKFIYYLLAYLFIVCVSIKTLSNMKSLLICPFHCSYHYAYNPTNICQIIYKLYVSLRGEIVSEQIVLLKMTLNSKPANGDEIEAIMGQSAGEQGLKRSCLRCF